MSCDRCRRKKGMKKQKNKGLEAVKSDMKTASVYVEIVEDRICGRIGIRMTDLKN